LDRAGNLYGTTVGGGDLTGPLADCGYGDVGGCGVVFKLDPTGAETVLYSFTGGADGGAPFAGVVGDTAGNLYGTTIYNLCFCGGVVFKLGPTGTESVLYSFTGGTGGTAGNTPYAGLVRDMAGNLYGTTSFGGDLSACLGEGCGVVFMVDPAGTETVLYSFTGGTDGGSPYAGLVRDGAGNLYGTTVSGGSLSGYGVVFKLDTAGTETVLHSFTGGADGKNPFAGLLRDEAGNLYGTTAGGGGPCRQACGVVFKMDPTGRFTVLHSFTGGADGGTPYGDLIRDTVGNLYGTTVLGGLGYGVVFKIGPTGRETVLYRFTGRADGANPYAGLVADNTGHLYGTAGFGGDLSGCGGSGCGVVFKITLPQASEPDAY
jgi:uncharacterized repeat protein (TIGR03803 family)